MPPLVPLAIVARALFMTPFRARTILEHKGVVRRLGPGQYRFIATDALASELPEVYRALESVLGSYPQSGIG